MVVSPAQFEALVSGMSTEQMDQVGTTLRERARQRRVVLTEERARAAVANAPLTPAWEKSQLFDVGQVRIATGLLVECGGYHPEQVVDAMSKVALDVIGHPAIAQEAVACGLADGMFAREGFGHDA